MFTELSNGFFLVRSKEGAVEMVKTFHARVMDDCEYGLCETQEETLDSYWDESPETYPQLVQGSCHEAQGVNYTYFVQLELTPVVLAIINAK